MSKTTADLLLYKPTAIPASLTCVAIIALSISTIYTLYNDMAFIGTLRDAINNDSIVDIKSAGSRIARNIISSMFLLSVVSFCVWHNRSYYNLQALGIFKLPANDNTSEFMKIIGPLLKPYHGMKELWCYSVAEENIRHNNHHIYHAAPSTKVLVFWWICWLASLWFNIILIFMYLLVNTTGMEITYNLLIKTSYVNIVSNIAMVIAGGVLVYMVRRVTAFQNYKYAQLYYEHMEHSGSGQPEQDTIATDTVNEYQAESVDDFPSDDSVASTDNDVVQHAMVYDPSEPVVVEQCWYDIDQKLHRDDGPARVWSDGTDEWYMHGVLHRETGPAVMMGNGDMAWYLNGELHRDDGPAIVYANGHVRYFLHGEEIEVTDI